jgi:hypothetical protein
VTDVQALCDDLKQAARFLMEDGHSLDSDEAMRIGTALIELAGFMRAAEQSAEPSEERQR